MTQWNNHLKAAEKNDFALCQKKIFTGDLCRTCVLSWYHTEGSCRENVALLLYCLSVCMWRLICALSTLTAWSLTSAPSFISPERTLSGRKTPPSSSLEMHPLHCRVQWCPAMERSPPPDPRPAPQVHPTQHTILKAQILTVSDKAKDLLPFSSGPILHQFR